MIFSVHTIIDLTEPNSLWKKIFKKMTSGHLHQQCKSLREAAAEFYPH